MSEMMGESRKQALKEILRRLHAGESPQALKQAFRNAVGNVSPQEIAQIEEELVRDGLPREELMKLCDLHLGLFEESLAGAELTTPPWHPLHILMAEHREMLAMANRLAARAREGVTSPEAEVEDLVKHLVGSESHYLREENVLFPYLERHGIVEPPKVMWAEHDRIRELKKAVVKAAPAGKDLVPAAIALSETLASHFLKENRILFPSGLRVIPEGAWPDIRRQFDEIGYCCFTPAAPPPPEAPGAPAPPAAPASSSQFRLQFPTGEFTPQELEAVLNALPVDITFVDADDTVRYFSASKDRIFVRTEAVLGRKVQDCHPQKSVHVVEKILADFKAGRRDVAEFWIPFGGKFVYIRYFPVRGRGGEYLGTVEVTQDIGPIQRISGERRLLDD
ncbi:DUF438 domain-containing protein [Candidatus Bipolaricaulota bacterium]|nr:DUF438 domain-containing protein [Candidatus Bipolaricaulota bacterium]